MATVSLLSAELKSPPLFTVKTPFLREVLEGTVWDSSHAKLLPKSLEPILVGHWD